MQTALIVTQEQVHENAKAHGFWPRPFGESIALLHSELSEALEEWRSGHKFDEIYYDTFFGPRPYPHTVNSKPEGIPIELADFTIRLMDLAESEEINLDMEKISYCDTTESHFPVLIADFHDGVSELYKAHKRQWQDGKKACLVGLISELRKACIDFGSPLFQAINLKHDYNLTRPYKHNKKC